MQVFDSIIQPAMGHLPVEDHGGAVSQETFLTELKNVLGNVARGLKDHPVIVAHSENNFDGSGVNRLLSNTFELEKVRRHRSIIHLLHAGSYRGTNVQSFPGSVLVKDKTLTSTASDLLLQLLDMAWKELPKKTDHKASKEYLRVALDGIASSAGLPPYGAISQVPAADR